MITNDLWLPQIIARSHKDKTMADKAIARLSDDELNRRPAPTFNSVATIMRHVGGNLVSRWTDFLTTDGDKPNRDRESEFADWTGTRSELLQHWDRGFAMMFSAIESLREEDLRKTITIRREPHTVPQAILRSLDHTAYHVGQILFLARLMHSGEWKFLTVAPGKSDEYKLQMHASHAAPSSRSTS